MVHIYVPDVYLTVNYFGAHCLSVGEREAVMITVEDKIEAQRQVKELEWLDAIGLEAMGLERSGSVFCPVFKANGITIDICPTSMDIWDVILPDGKHLHEMFDIPKTLDEGEYCHCPEAAKYLYERIGLINPDD